MSYLFAGSIEHVMRDLFAPTRRAFSGFGSFYSLRPITDDEWRSGLSERFAADDCVVAGPALERIVDLGGGHPRDHADRPADSSAVDRARHPRDRSRSGAARLRAGARRRPPDDGAGGGAIRLHKHGLLVVRSVAAGESPPRRLHAGVRDRVLKLLRDAGVIEHEARGRWRVIDPLLRHYLATLDPFG